MNLLAGVVVLMLMLAGIIILMTSCRAIQDALSTLEVTVGKADFDPGRGEREWVAVSVRPLEGARSPQRIEVVGRGPDPFDLDFNLPSTLPFIKGTEKKVPAPEPPWWRTAAGMTTVITTTVAALGALGYGAKKKIESRRHRG